MAKNRRENLMALQRFAEGGEAQAAPATGVTGSGAAIQQEPQPALRTRKGTPVYDPAPQQAEPEPTTGQTVPAEVPADTYESLVRGPNARFKQEYDADVQAIVQNRLRTAKAQQAKVQGLLKVIGERYGIDTSNPDSIDMEELTAAVIADQKYLEAEAAEQGMTPDQLSLIKKLQYQVDQRHVAEQATIEEQRQRALFERIAREADELKSIYPSIDVRNEVQDPRFMSMMQTGVPVKNAYIALHPELMQQVASEAAQAAQQRVAAQIQAGARRPTENGIGSTASYTDIDVRDPKVRQELRRRAMAGEKVILP